MPGFGFLLQGSQSTVPEVIQVSLQADECPGIGPVEPLGALASFPDQARLLQHRKVLGNRRPGDAKVPRNGSGRQLLLADQVEDLAPVGIDPPSCPCSAGRSSMDCTRARIDSMSVRFARLSSM